MHGLPGDIVSDWDPVHRVLQTEPMNQYVGSILRLRAFNDPLAGCSGLSFALTGQKSPLTMPFVDSVVFFLSYAQNPGLLIVCLICEVQDWMLRCDGVSQLCF